VIGRLLTEFHSGPSRKELIEAYGTALRGQAIEGERELLTRTGALIPVMMRGDPIFDAERAVIGTRKMYVDISERKHAEDEFRLVVESAPNGMLMLDENGVITLVNTQMEILFGYRREDLLGQSRDPRAAALSRFPSRTARTIFQRSQGAYDGARERAIWLEVGRYRIPRRSRSQPDHFVAWPSGTGFGDRHQ
jgi:PAS domain-containing protein